MCVCARVCCSLEQGSVSWCLEEGELRGAQSPAPSTYSARSPPETLVIKEANPVDRRPTIPDEY